MAHDDDSHTPERLTNIAHLSSAVGHHVINAYSTIVSNAEILLLTADPAAPADPVAVAARIIINTAVDAATVARRLIDYSRPVTTIGDELIPLDRLIAEIFEESRANGHDRFTWDVHPGPVPPIRGHADQLRAMIGHLIRNAEESMAGVEGRIALSSAIDDRGWIAVEVVDTGPGMTPEIQGRAVEPFFTTKNGRMGVGLSIANGIWRRHRGTMALKTRPGEGTRVRLCVNPVEGGLPGLR